MQLRQSSEMNSLGLLTAFLIPANPFSRLGSVKVFYDEVAGVMLQHVATMKMPLMNGGQSGPIATPHGLELLKTFGFIPGLTLLISTIEVPGESKAGLRASWGNGYFWTYFAILMTGNSAAGVLSFAFLPLSSGFDSFAPFLHAFVGVFAFQGIMSNTNATFLDKGVLTIDDWISKARELAVAGATQKQVRADQAARRRTGETPARMEEDKLKVYIDTHLGREAFEEICSAAETHGESAKLYKALEFVKRDPENAAAIASGAK